LGHRRSLMTNDGSFGRQFGWDIFSLVKTDDNQPGDSKWRFSLAVVVAETTLCGSNVSHHQGGSELQYGPLSFLGYDHDLSIRTNNQQKHQQYGILRRKSVFLDYSCNRMVSYFRQACAVFRSGETPLLRRSESTGVVTVAIMGDAANGMCTQFFIFLLAFERDLRPEQANRLTAAGISSAVHVYLRARLKNQKWPMKTWRP